MNETTTTVVGNVVDTPLRRRLESGVSVTTFRVASTSRRFDRTANRWVDGESLFLRVTCWRALAENTAHSLVKGDPVIVTGKLFTRLYEVGEARRASYELEATAAGFDLNRGQGAFTRTNSTKAVTVDDTGPDGMPTGSAIDARLESQSVPNEQSASTEAEGDAAGLAGFAAEPTPPTDENPPEPEPTEEEPPTERRGRSPRGGARAGAGV